MGMNLNNTQENVTNEFRSAFSAALTNQSQDEMTKAIEAYSTGICSAMLNEYESMSAAERCDASALAARGVRQLTNEENKYYSKLISAMRMPGNKIKQSMEDIIDVMPQTIIDQVMTDVQTSFPLLEAVDFQNTSFLTYWLFNAQGRQIATWDAIDTEITKELSGAFQKIDVAACKLTAFVAISNDYLDLGPAWLDRYVRAILTEACGYAMETSIINGTGGKAPVGMCMDMTTGSVDAQGYVSYTAKTATAITDLSPSTYGTLLAGLTKTDTGRERPVKNLILVVNPTDYYTKIMPATTVILPSGGYAHDVLPVETRIIQSVGVPSGKAILGLGDEYLACLGVGSKQGTISYDDSYRFLEDQRVYKIRLLGNGRPKDNTAFAYLDISGLTALYYRVKEV